MLLLLRSARKPDAMRGLSRPQRFAHFMLSVFKYMIPSSEQPVRASRVAELLPEPLTLVPDDQDPGAVAMIFADWQSCGDDLSELRSWARAIGGRLDPCLTCSPSAEGSSGG